MTHAEWVADVAAQLHAIYDGVGDLTEAQIDRTDPLVKGAHEDYASRVGTPVPMGAVGEAYGRWWHLNAIRSAEVLHGYTARSVTRG